MLFAFPTYNSTPPSPMCLYTPGLSGSVLRKSGLLIKAVKNVAFGCYDFVKYTNVISIQNK